MNAWYDIAAHQYGLISRTQLLATGLSSDAIWRRAKSGLWVQVLPGVYRVNGAPHAWEQEVWAPCLWGGEAAVASHQTAAAVWELEGFERSDLIVISGTRKNPLPGMGFSVHRSFPDSRFVTRAPGVPVTNPSRTLMDLGAVLENVRLLERALEDALRRELTSVRQLRWGFEQLLRPGRPGVGVLRVLVDQRGYCPSASDFQKRFRKLLAGAGLKAAEEYVIRIPGERSRRVDFAFVEQKVAVEADGWTTHSSRTDWQADLARRNVLTGAGWRVLHFTWWDLAWRPDEVVVRIRAALAAADEDPIGAQ